MHLVNADGRRATKTGVNTMLMIKYCLAHNVQRDCRQIFLQF